MDTAVSNHPANWFRTPEASLKRLDVATALELVNHAADVTLIIDDRGIVADLAYSDEKLANDGIESWIGEAWIDTVTVESRPKIEDLLNNAQAMPPRRWRQVNHPSPTGVDLPLRYLTLEARSPGWSVAIGRDLRNEARLQQRLVQAQLAIERDYERLREAESRYQVLFQMAKEGVLIVNAGTGKITDANSAAAALLEEPAERLAGRSVLGLFADPDSSAVEELLALTRRLGSAEPVEVSLARTQRRVQLSASLVKQAQASHFLLKLDDSADQRDSESDANGHGVISRVVEAMPDAFVVADQQMNILAANDAFLQLADLASELQARTCKLSQFVGREGVDLNVLLANLKEHGSVRNFSTIVRSLHQVAEEVEISAVAVPEGDRSCYGFTIRTIGRRLTGLSAVPGLPRSVEQLTDMVGRVSLKEIVRETTDLIERMCIEAALSLTGDNRASAAEMLGLSRQSLYSKLHRHSLGDLSTEPRE